MKITKEDVGRKVRLRGGEVTEIVDFDKTRNKEVMCSNDLKYSANGKRSNFNQSRHLDMIEFVDEEPKEQINDLSGVKVGDKLWHVTHGWVTVEKVDMNLCAPIRAFNRWFRMDGKYLSSDCNPSLLWDNPIIEYPKKPEIKIECELEFEQWIEEMDCDETNLEDYYGDDARKLHFYDGYNRAKLKYQKKRKG